MANSTHVAICVCVCGGGGGGGGGGGLGDMYILESFQFLTGYRSKHISLQNHLVQEAPMFC